MGKKGHQYLHLEIFFSDLRRCDVVNTRKIKMVWKTHITVNLLKKVKTSKIIKNYNLLNWINIIFGKKIKVQKASRRMMKQKDNPLVTVIIPTYKRVKKLARAINSVYNQTYDNIEIIIINDDPNSVIEKFIDLKKNVKWINHKRNQGPSAARNSGIQRAKGKYIAFLDDDDFFLKTKIEKLVNSMESLNNEWIGIYSWYIREKSRKVIKSNAEGDLSLPLLKCNMHLAGGSSLLLKTDIVKSIGGFNISYQIHEDWNFILKLCKKGKIKLFKEPLFVVGTSEHHHSHVSPENFLKVKFKYLKDLNSFISSYGYKTSKRIHTAHLSRVAILFLNKRKISESLKVFYKIFRYSPLNFIIEFFNFIRRRISLE